MINVEGMKWKELTEEEQEMLLKYAMPIDGQTGDEMTEDGECIVDFAKHSICSIGGRFEDGEISIDDETVFYNPEDGTVTKEWADRIRLARKRVGLTQRQMSEALNIPESTIKDWERGARTPADWTCDLLVEKLNNIARRNDL